MGRCTSDFIDASNCPNSCNKKTTGKVTSHTTEVVAQVAMATGEAAVVAVVATEEDTDMGEDHKVTQTVVAAGIPIEEDGAVEPSGNQDTVAHAIHPGHNTGVITPAIISIPTNNDYNIINKFYNLIKIINYYH